MLQESPTTEENRDTHQHLVKNTALMVALAGVIMSFITLLVDVTTVQQLNISSILLNTYLIFIGTRLKLGKSIPQPAVQVVIGFTLLFTLVTFNAGGINSPIMALSPAIPLMGVLLSEYRLAAITTIYLLVLTSLFLYLGLSEGVPGQARYLIMRSTGLVMVILLCFWTGWYYSMLNSRLLNELEIRSNTDYLTGLLNRRALDNVFDREFHRALRTESWLSTIIIDIDDFKKINDTFGHEQGDLCLKFLASTLIANVMRAGDTIGRFGGEEFFIVLPSTEHEGAMIVAERLRQAVETNSQHTENIPPMTISLGVGTASITRHINQENFYRQSDDMLYECKATGKNKALGCIITPESEQKKSPPIQEGQVAPEAKAL